MVLRLSPMEAAMQVRTLRSSLVALALAAFVPFAAAVFTPNMTLVQIEAQVKTQLTAGATLDQIAAAALAANLNPAVVTAAMISAGGNPAGAVSAMLRAGALLQTVVDAALGAGASIQAVTQGALAANVALANIDLAIKNSDQTAAPTASITDLTTSPTGTTTPTGSAGAGGGGGTGGGGTASPS